MKAKMKPYDAYMFHRNASDEQDRFANAALKKGDRETAKIHMKLSKKHADKAIRAIAESLEEIMDEGMIDQVRMHRLQRRRLNLKDKEDRARTSGKSAETRLAEPNLPKKIRRNMNQQLNTANRRSMSAIKAQDRNTEKMIAIRKRLGEETDPTDAPIMERMEIAMIAKEHDCTFDEARSMYAKMRLAKKYGIRESVDSTKIGTPMIDYEKNAETIGNKVKAIVQAQADRYMRDGMDQETRKTLKEAYWDKPANPKQTGWKPRSVKAERERREDKIRAEKTRRMGRLSESTGTPVHAHYVDRMGHVTIRNTKTGTSAYLQGDDARQFHSEYDAHEKKFGHLGPHRLDHFVSHHGYDELLH